MAQNGVFAFFALCYVWGGGVGAGCHKVLHLRSYPLSSVNTLYATFYHYFSFGKHTSCYVLHFFLTSVSTLLATFYIFVFVSVSTLHATFYTSAVFR